MPVKKQMSAAKLKQSLSGAHTSRGVSVCHCLSNKQHRGETQSYVFGLQLSKAHTWLECFPQ